MIFVNPKTNSIRIRRPANSKFGPSGELTEADTISGEDVLTGFECIVKEFPNLIQLILTR